MQNISTDLQQNGYCIFCQRPIIRNINSPICFSCSDFSNISIQSGRYCHGCGCVRRFINLQFPFCKEICRAFSDSDEIDEYYTNRLKFFQQMRLIEDRSITPIWNFEEVNNYSMHSYLKYFQIVDLFNTVIPDDRLNTTDIFENSVSDNKRTMNILGAWRVGINILIPSIVIDDFVYFNDGRHRTLAAHFLGEQLIPVLCIGVK